MLIQQGFAEAWEGSCKPIISREARSARWDESRRAFKRLLTVDDIDASARNFLEMFPDCPPDGFDQIASNGEQFYNNSGRMWALAKKATAPGGWATRLQAQVSELVFVSAKAADFGLGDEYADPGRYYDPAFVKRWKAAIRRCVRGPHWWRLEIGVNGRVHAHLLADAKTAEGLGVPEVVYDLTGIVRYLKKGIPYTPENLATYSKARRELGARHLPRHSGRAGIWNKKRYHSQKACKELEGRSIGRPVQGADIRPKRYLQPRLVLTRPTALPRLSRGSTALGGVTELTAE